jgi:hypothetical protein
VKRRTQGCGDNPAHARSTQASEANLKLSADETNAMIYPVVINQSIAKTFWPDRSRWGDVFFQREEPAVAAGVNRRRRYSGRYSPGLG